MVEGLGVSQVFAFLPSYLREMGVAEAERLPFVGLFTVADLRRRGAARAAVGRLGRQVQPQGRHRPERLVEAVVFACVALSREPWQLALSLLLIGFQLGQHRGDAGGDPRRRPAAPARDGDRDLRRVAGRSGSRSGRSSAASSSSTGSAGRCAGVFWLSAVLSLGTALLVAVRLARGPARGRARRAGRSTWRSARSAASSPTRRSAGSS